MDYDINELTKQCENIEPKVQERKRENQRQKFDSFSYEKERQEMKKKILREYKYIYMKIIYRYLI